MRACFYGSMEKNHLLLLVFIC